MTGAIDPQTYVAKPASIIARIESNPGTGGTLRFLIVDHARQESVLETTLHFYARLPLRVLLPQGSVYERRIDRTLFAQKGTQEQDGAVYQVFQNF
jgi:hypothetical protein